MNHTHITWNTNTGNGPIYQGGGPPMGAVIGTIWLQTSTGKVYIYDGTSVSTPYHGWAEVSALPSQPQPNTTIQTLEYRGPFLQGDANRVPPFQWEPDPPEPPTQEEVDEALESIRRAMGDG